CAPHATPRLPYTTLFGSHARRWSVHPDAALRVARDAGRLILGPLCGNRHGTHRDDDGNARDRASHVEFLPAEKGVGSLFLRDLEIGRAPSELQSRVDLVC